MATNNGVDLTPGPVMSTGRELDASINGEGWFAVQAADGGEGYTRAGDFKISPTGALMTGRGYPVLGNSGTPIAIPPAEKVDIGADGTISIRPVGQAPNALVIVDRIKMVNPQNSDLTKDIDGLIKLKNGGTADADANIRLLAGSLEGSNVNTVEAMVNMIALARQFETQVKLMHVADENDKSSTQLMRIG
jgi:flagellar basal-body rod protein FlgF